MHTLRGVLAGTLLSVLLFSAAAPLTTAQSSPATVTKEQVDKWMADLSNWGRWGKDDGIGTLNLVTPAKRKDALKLVRDGISVSLAHTIDKERAADNPQPLGQQMTLDA